MYIHELTHLEQEQKGDCNFFNVEVCMTRNFGLVVPQYGRVVQEALTSIKERYGTKADYLQVFIYKDMNTPETKFWVIHDGEHVTFLLPEDY